jgi:hypothetical protein
MIRPPSSVAIHKIDRKIWAEFPINTGGKSLQEITNFPIIESPPPDEAKPPPADNNAAPQRVPQVIAGHCVGWRDRDELDDADPEELP